jgi:hypothetical protein
MESKKNARELRTATLLLHCDLRVGIAADLTRFVQARRPLCRA